VQAALRETVEETALDVAQVRITGRHDADHGDWSYVTLLGEVDTPLPVQPERESVDLRWVGLDDVTSLPLHHGFATAWPLLRPRLAV
jgi:8-oxo-dGTP pyrophosphatase MutT (NUDIX family)